MELSPYLKWNRRIEEKIFGISLGPKLILASQELEHGHSLSALNYDKTHDPNMFGGCQNTLKFVLVVAQFFFYKNQYFSA